MFLEGAIVGTTVYSVYRIFNRDKILNKKKKKEITLRWQVLMDSIGSNAENKIEQQYEILEIFDKHYGFDMILSMPFGKKFNDVLGMIPLIEGCYKANVMMNLSSDKNTVYVRVHFLDSDINQKDKLRFDWFKTFYNMDGCITKSGETLNIDKIEEVISPKKEIVGYRIKSKIPFGLSYDKIRSSYDVITRTLGKCFFDFDFKTMQLETTINHKRIEDDEEFIPIKVEPWQLYVAMGYDWNPIILDYSLSANTLIGGMQGTGKTVALIMAFINLCNQCDNFDLVVCNMGEKNDLRVFRDVKQCKYYANDEIEVLSLLRYLKQEMNRRNKLFSEQDHFCFNIFQYNKMIKDKSKQLKVIHFIADEIADLMENENIQELLWDIIRKSRSSGIYITVATQRASLKNLSGEVKGQLGNKVGFSQPNTASALTVMSGEDVAKKIMTLEKRRECLVDYTEGVKVAKTLFLNEKMMENLLKDVITKEDNKLKLDQKGNIINKSDEDVQENTLEPKDTKETVKKSESTKKEPRWKQKKAKK